MSDNKPTQLAKIIEFIHRRGYANGKENPSMLAIELVQLTWDCDWDVDKFMEDVSMDNPDFVDYGFNKRAFLKSVTTEIFSETDEAHLHTLNETLFSFSGEFKSLGYNWKNIHSLKNNEFQNEVLPPSEP